MLALTSILNVGERFVLQAKRFWWAYRIAFEFGINPQEVKNWDADDVMEALAAIAIREAHAKKKPPSGEVK